MVRKRTVWEQVKSGLRIGGSMVLSFLFLIALWSSVALLTLQNTLVTLHPHPLLGGLVLVVLSAVLFLTTKILGKMAFCSTGVLRV